MTFVFEGFTVASFFAPVLRNVSCEHHTIEIHIQNKCYDFFFFLPFLSCRLRLQAWFPCVLLITVNLSTVPCVFVLFFLMDSLFVTLTCSMVL